MLGIKRKIVIHFFVFQQGASNAEKFDYVSVALFFLSLITAIILKGCGTLLVCFL